MKIEEVMSAAPRTCRPEDDLALAASELWVGDVGFLPVVDGDGCIFAVVTDRDICMCAYTRGLPLGELCVQDCMSEPVHTCRPHQDTDHAIELMAEHRVRRLPVVDAEGHPGGVISLVDVARAAMRQRKGYASVARTLNGIAVPHGAPPAPPDELRPAARRRARNAKTAREGTGRKPSSTKKGG